jgi:hypothetical protein
MIRHRSGNDFLLITQNDHALFSGLLAQHLGNGRFLPPSPLIPTVQGIAMHDSGWRMHDDTPLLDERGYPMHVLHTPFEISSRAWTASVEEAVAKHPWSGLLVSQHVLRLSSLPHEGNGRDGMPANPRVVFEINKLQHRQIEIQESLRQALGLRTDIPLTLGLAPAGTNDDEDLLLVAAGWMRALDSLSLDICCDTPLFDRIDAVFPRPGAQPVRLAVRHPGWLALTLDPWPFDVDEIVEEIPFRRVPARAYSSLQEFRDVYAVARIEKTALRIKPLGQ